MAAPPRKIFSSQENVHSASIGGDGVVVQQQQQSGPPKAPRSAFMCFTDAKKREILGSNFVKQNAEILKIVADEWRKLSARDRAYWDEEARNDKLRFVREKAAYKGPWNLPKRRAKKHPLAPKRPMSAFLKYSQNRRSQVKMSNSDLSNTDVSRLLGEMWRSASPAEKKPYVEEEKIERAKYKVDTKRWRESQARLDAASRTSHHSVQREAAKKPRKKQPPAHDYGRVFMEPSASAAYAPQPYRAHSANSGSADRRVFRPYSGCGHPIEIEAPKPYKVEHQMIHPSYDHNEVIPPPPPPGKFDSQMFRDRAARPSPTERLPFETLSVDDSKVESSIHRHQPQPAYGPFHLPESHQHVAPLKNTGSDISQFEGFGSFAEPDPPFNPRQQRPAASHYFTESFYKYP